MTFKLGDIKDWDPTMTCTPTALCALTGKTPTEIAKLLSDVSTRNGRPIEPELQYGYNINDWLALINELGGDWVPSEDFSDRPFDQRPTIDDWMKERAFFVEPELVFCDNGGKIGHVFAVDEQGDVVDTYTNGKRVKFTGVPPSYQMLRVKRTFLFTR